MEPNSNELGLAHIAGSIGATSGGEAVQSSEPKTVAPDGDELSNLRDRVEALEKILARRYYHEIVHEYGKRGLEF